MSGFNFIEKVVGHNQATMVSALVVTGGLCYLAAIGSKRAIKASDAIVPDETLTIKNFWDLVVSFIVSLGDSVMGKENRKYLPLVGSIFIFILFSNFFGLIPGFLSPTSSVTFNFGMAIVVFVCYHFWGIRETGFLKYMAHFGMIELPSLKKIFIFIPAAFLWVVLFCIEMISHVVRPITLSVRLFANMTADHAVLGVFTDLVGQFGVATIFYFMGTFICTIQAFVFTVLTMVYIRLACGHGEGEH
jgi:F-type H+-transporting ATPase subunit a